MSPSSPVSVGILPSNRTLEVGVAHLEAVVSAPKPMSEHIPVTDDPFTDTTLPVRKENADGITNRKNRRNLIPVPTYNSRMTSLE